MTLDLTKLNAKFDESLIKERRGSYGKTLIYVETPEYIKRLNDIFEGEWDWSVTTEVANDNFIVVKGHLRTGMITKEAFGSAVIKKAKSTGQPINLGDDYKSAASDALKKACSLFGIGLHLWEDEDDSEPVAPFKPAPKIVLPVTKTPKSDPGGVQQQATIERMYEAFGVHGVDRKQLEIAVNKPDILWDSADVMYLRLEFDRLRKALGDSQSWMHQVKNRSE